MWSSNDDTNWSSWYSLGGNIISHAVGKNEDGRIEVFALTAAGMLWHKWQVSAGATTSWSSWHLIGGDVTGTGSNSQGDLSGPISVTSDSEGRLAVVIADDNHRGWIAWQKSPNSQLWSTWTSICESASAGFVVLHQHPANDGIGLIATMSQAGTRLKICSDAHCRGEDPKVIPVLQYHGIGMPNPGQSAALFIERPVFENQLDALLASGYTPVTFGELERLCEINRPVMLTFDDGLEQNYSEMFPALQARGIAATEFIISSRIDTNSNHYTSGQMSVMSALIDFQNHTVSHTDLTSLPSGSVGLEIDGATSFLSSWNPISTLSYPMGHYNLTTVVPAVVARLHFAITTRSGLYRQGQSRYEIPRLFVSNTWDGGTLVGQIDNLRCAHSEYEIGVALNEGCGGGIPAVMPNGDVTGEMVCTRDVCAAQPACCTTTWNSSCVELARQLCDISN